MSIALKNWGEVEEKFGIDIRSEFDEMYGPYFSNGINIGREVGYKLNNNIQPWPTLLQIEGLDSGLTRGFLTSLNICLVEGIDHLTDLSDHIKNSYGFYTSYEKIDYADQLKERYPGTEYYKYPSLQQWSMPGVLIHYSK
jgi:hypothetical protein